MASEKCELDAFGTFGNPPRSIMGGCEWCKNNVECFLLVGRDYEAELKAREEKAEKINAAVKKDIGLED